MVDQTHEELPAAALVDLTHEEQPPAAGLVDQNNTSGKFSSDAEAADEGQQENALPQLLGEENIQLLSNYPSQGSYEGYILSTMVRNR